MSGTTRRLAPWAIFAGALLVRLVYVFEAGRADPLFASVEFVADSQLYDLSARAVAAGDLRPAGAYFLAPLYFYVMGALYALVGPSVLAVQLLQCLLGALSCVLVQRIGQRVFSPAAGSLAGAGLALYGLHVFYAGVLLPTVLVTFLNLAFLWLVVDAEPRPSARRLFLAGAVLGLAVAAKPNALLMLPATAAALFWIERREGAGPWALRAAVLAAGAILTLSPFLAHNRAVAGEFVFVTTTGGRNLLKGNGPGANGTHIFFPHDMRRTGLQHYLEGDVPAEVAVREDRNMRTAARRFMLEHPQRTATLVVKKLALFFNATELSIRDQYYFAKRYSTILSLPLLGFGAVVPLALVALAVAWRGRPRAWLLYGTLAAQLASYVPLFVLARYRMVAVACLLPFAAHGLLAVAEQVRARRLRPFAGAAAAWLVAWVFVHLPFAEFPRDRGFADRWRGIGDHALAKGDSAGALAAYHEALSARWLHPEQGLRRLELRVQIARAQLAAGALPEAQREIAGVRAALPADRAAWPLRVQALLASFERERRRAPGGGR